MGNNRENGSDRSEGSGQGINLTLFVLPGKPGEAPPEVRLKQALKLLLRAFRIRAEWGTEPELKPGEGPKDTHDRH